MTAKHLGQIILMRQDDGPGTPGEHAHHLRTRDASIAVEEQYDKIHHHCNYRQHATK
jgi:hypothetical protein